MKRHSIFLVPLAILILHSLLACGTTPSTTPDQPNLHYEVSREGLKVEVSGDPFVIETDNCGSEKDLVKREERTKSYVTEFSIEISNEIAAEFEGNVAVAKATLRDQVGLALGAKLGAEVQHKSAVEFVTPAGKKTVTTLQWEEEWTEGSIGVRRSNGEQVDVLPFLALNSVVLKQVESLTLDCPAGATPTASPTTPPTATLTDTPIASPTATGYVSVEGIDEWTMAGEALQTLDIAKDSTQICIDDKEPFSSSGRFFTTYHTFAQEKHFDGVEVALEHSIAEGAWHALGFSSAWGTPERKVKIGFFLAGPSEDCGSEEAYVSVVWQDYTQEDSEFTEQIDQICVKTSQAHTLRIEKDCDTVTMFVDSREVAERSIGYPEARGYYLQLEAISSPGSALGGCWQSVKVKRIN